VYYAGSICWDILFGLVKNRGITKLRLGDDDTTNNLFTETSLPEKIDVNALKMLQVLDVHGLDYLSGAECKNAVIVYGDVSTETARMCVLD
jgi:hypothetical protein